MTSEARPRSPAWAKKAPDKNETDQRKPATSHNAAQASISTWSAPSSLSKAQAKRCSSKSSPKISALFRRIGAARLQVEQALEQAKSVCTANSKGSAQARGNSGILSGNETSQKSLRSDFEAYWGENKLLPPALAGTEEGDSGTSSENKISQKSLTSDFEAQWGQDKLQSPASAGIEEPVASCKATGRSPPPHQLSRALVQSEGRPMVRLSREETQRQKQLSAEMYLTEDSWGEIESDEKCSGGTSQRIGGRLTAADVPYETLKPLREMTAAKLEHGLDRVLFNPGVHLLRDPRSGIYNYPPYLRSIPDVDFFDYQALTPYTTSSKDDELVRVAQRENAQFCGSTSSLTAILSQTYFLISAWKAPETANFSTEFADQPKGFSLAAKLPAAIAVTPRSSPSAPPNSKPVYAIDQDKQAAGEAMNSNYVLTSLGKSMEKWLTATPHEYSTYLRVVRGSKVDAQSQSDQPSADVGRVEAEKEAYHYAKAGKAFVMRSQLDCIDDRLPRKTFDLKTRAVASVRFDRANWSQAGGYQINHLNGLWESFERERYDMSRSAWLKYYLQARIGNMDGIFVAYHNAARCFGFEYFPLEDIAERVFGIQEMAEQAFRLSVGLCERILDRAVELYPGRTLRLTFETPEIRSSANQSDRGNSENVMQVWVQPKEQDGSVAAGEVTQLDVTVDRYFRDSLIKGPISFKELKRQEDEGFDDVTEEDEIAESMIGRTALSAKNRPFEWSIEWMIDPRPDLDKTKIYEKLEQATSRLQGMTSLVLPDIDYVNEREVRLQKELSRSPAALLKYKQDKHSGVAAGMPRAPGQVELFALDDDGVEASQLIANMQEGSNEVHSETLADATSTLWTDPSNVVRALRIRSHRGEIEARQRDTHDQLKQFRSTSRHLEDDRTTPLGKKKSD